MEPVAVILAILFVAMSAAYAVMAIQLRTAAKKLDESNQKNDELQKILNKSIDENIALRTKLNKNLEKSCELTETLEQVHLHLKEE